MIFTQVGQQPYPGIGENGARKAINQDKLVGRVETCRLRLAVGAFIPGSMARKEALWRLSLSRSGRSSIYASPGLLLAVPGYRLLYLGSLAVFSSHDSRTRSSRRSARWILLRFVEANDHDHIFQVIGLGLLRGDPAANIGFSCGCCTVLQKTKAIEIRDTTDLFPFQTLYSRFVSLRIEIDFTPPGIWEATHSMCNNLSNSSLIITSLNRYVPTVSGVCCWHCAINVVDRAHQRLLSVFSSLNLLIQNR